MAGKSEIEAGRAYVSLMLKDKGFAKGLDAAGQRLKSIGRGVSIFGAAISGIGASIATPLVAIAKGFADSGSAVHDMAARTKMSVESLQELGYAAEQTGTSMEAIEKAINKAREQGKSFDSLAAKIAAIEDPAKRSEKAIELFGVKLGPSIEAMLGELPELRKRFHELGLGMSKEDTDAADSLGDAFADLRLVIKSARDAIGAALAPAIQKVTGAITNIAVRVRDWIRQHKELFVTALKVGAGLVVLGGIITTLGGVVSAVGFALIGFNVAMGVAASVLGAIVSPIGLVIGGLIGLATWFATSTQFGQQMVKSLAGWFGKLKDIAVGTFQGIADALAAGNLTLAANVAWAGLKAAWLQGTDELRKTWIGFKNVFRQTTIDIIMGAATAWEKFTSYIESLFIGMRTRVVSTVMRVGAFLEGIGKSDAQKKEIEDTLQFGLRANEKLAAGRQTALEAERKKALDEIASIKANAADQIDNNTQKELAAAQKALKDAQSQLDTLKGQASKEAKDKAIGAAPEFKASQFDLNAEKLNNRIFGTFSAAAAMSQGGGTADSPVTKAINAQERQNERRHRELVRELHGLFMAN